MRVKVEARLGEEVRHDWSRRESHELPETWREAREQAACATIDETVSLGDAFDKASARVFHLVSRNRQTLRGVPCVRNTRVPVYQICGMLAEGYTTKRVARFLSISEDDVKAALRFASALFEQ